MYNFHAETAAVEQRKDQLMHAAKMQQLAREAQDGDRETLAARWTRLVGDLFSAKESARVEETE